MLVINSIKHKIKKKHSYYSVSCALEKTELMDILDVVGPSVPLALTPDPICTSSLLFKELICLLRESQNAHLRAY
jgi:hypothetical protein